MFKPVQRSWEKLSSATMQWRFWCQTTWWKSWVSQFYRVLFVKDNRCTVFPFIIIFGTSIPNGVPLFMLMSFHFMAVRANCCLWYFTSSFLLHGIFSSLHLWHLFYKESWSWRSKKLRFVFEGSGWFTKYVYKIRSSFMLFNEPKYSSDTIWTTEILKSKNLKRCCVA